MYCTMFSCYHRPYVFNHHGDKPHSYNVEQKTPLVFDIRKRKTPTRPSQYIALRVLVVLQILPFQPIYLALSAIIICLLVGWK
jgi:hypothetical protein